MAFSSLVGFIFSLFLVNLSIISSTEVSHDGRSITINGQPRILLSGAIHYPRSTPEMWSDLMKKAKEGGLDAIETYVFWNAHEPLPGQYDFSGNHDLIKFIKTVRDNGLFVVLRIGPYVCAEWNYGGFPVWLHNMPGLSEFRTVDDVYMNAMQTFTTLIVDMVKKENLFASQGGPVIIAQIENEYGNVYEPYGDAGKAYLDWCAKFATSLEIGVPWIMCQQKDAPEPMLETCNGWYCDKYKPTNPTTPKLWTENWTGWFKNWGGKDPYRTAEDVAFAVARFFQSGGTFQNYYMYHGGTNFGRTSGGPYITTTYDYDAPLDEYGHLKQPKYGHLKQLHDVLHSIEKALTTGNITTTELGNSLQTTVFALDNTTSACFLSNENETADATINYNGIDYDVPAWSVSILPDCKTVAFNTAKVNTQKSVMVKDTATNSSSLKWSWRPEKTDDTVILGKGDFSANQLFDQKITNDVSDYFWYMASVNLRKDDPIWSNEMSIRINNTGHPMHLYVNGKYVDSQWTTYGIHTSTFETKIKFKHGKNQISILSAAVGLQNYGSFFDLWGTGISGGPIHIVGKNGDETITKDLSSHKWSYKIGLHGEAEKLFSSNQSRLASKWHSDILPINKRMTWYKATFKAPAGSDPVVVDLLGLGKGLAWVNGNNIGRYWPSYLAEEKGCSLEPCDYRGSYDNNKCVYNCGQPTQRWYHVPRSFLNNNGDNELVLFEEIGGNPSKVSFQTVRAGSVCANAYENKVAEISCHGRPISAIKYAHFGETKGPCGSSQKGSCGSAKDALTILKTVCEGKLSCRVKADENIFGKTNCDKQNKRLVVEAVC